jgi:hypothetical protein
MSLRRNWLRTAIEASEMTLSIADGWWAGSPRRMGTFGVSDGANHRDFFNNYKRR